MSIPNETAPNPFPNQIAYFKPYQGVGKCDRQGFVAFGRDPFKMHTLHN